jgi:hypothetical protein
MNTFNRAFTIVGLIVLLVLGALALIAPGAFIGLVQAAADTAHATLFAGVNDTVRVLVRVLMALALVLLGGAFLYLEFRRNSGTIEVARGGGGKIRVQAATVEAKLREQIEGLGEIVSAKVKIGESRKAVNIKIEASTTQTADPIAKGNDIARVAAIVLQDQMGLRLNGKPQVVVNRSKSKVGKPQTTTLLNPPSAIGLPAIAAPATSDTSPPNSTANAMSASESAR